jgi:hypothetical protein
MAQLTGTVTLRTVLSKIQGMMTAVNTASPMAKKMIHGSLEAAGASAELKWNTWEIDERKFEQHRFHTHRLRIRSKTDNLNHGKCEWRKLNRSGIRSRSRLALYRREDP